LKVDVLGAWDDIMKQEKCQKSGGVELVRKAFNEGYFETPRETSLVQVASDLDIDTQEASVQLRRELREHFDECLE
jgi:hypothetical protein